MVNMPGESLRGPLPELTTDEASLIAVLRRDVDHLCGEIGDRNVVAYEGLCEAADFIEAELKQAGYEVERQGYDVKGKICYNMTAEIRGHEKANEIIVIGGHYDSVSGCPGANDNGTGALAVVALAREFAGKRFARTLRFVTFVNEEPPYFQTAAMGSRIYARRCRKRRENIVAMLSLETIGYYSDEPGSQKYPFPFSLFYPETGNFIAFVANTRSRRLVRQVIATFRREARFPSEGVATFGWLPGIGWSDQWSFWQEGYPGIMVTDTAPFRYPHYHRVTDTPDKIDYERFARVVSGIGRTMAEMAEMAEIDGEGTNVAK